MSYTTDPDDPRLGHGVDEEKTEQHEVYLILSDEERAKGFVRPLRRAYRHTGQAGPKNPLRELTDEERERWGQYNYAYFESYPESEDPRVGRYWTQAMLDAVGKGCGTVTTMSLPLCETYARQPDFYGATYCVGCQRHLPLAEFRWVEDGEVVGS